MSAEDIRNVVSVIGEHIGAAEREMGSLCWDNREEFRRADVRRDG